MLDAKRISDGTPVFLKAVSKASPEVGIGRYLSLRNDPRNHAVPILDSLDDPVDPEQVILVMPVLRQIDQPLPASIRECADFLEQTLEVSMVRLFRRRD